MAPHSSTLAQRIPWTEEPGRLQSMGQLESDTTEQLHFHFSLSCIGEGNGNPLQCSCLENPRDGGSLVGCRLWGHTESDTTEVTQQQVQVLEFLITRITLESPTPGACFHLLLFNSSRPEGVCDIPTEGDGRHRLQLTGHAFKASLLLCDPAQELNVSMPH